MLKRRVTSGFTLVELSISVIFISLLSLTIAMITTSVVSSFQRGLSIKQINSVGSEIIRDVRDSIAKSTNNNIFNLCSTAYPSATDVSNLEACKKDLGQRFLSVSRLATVTLADGEEISSVPIFGAVCTGSYSYIWNSGYLFGDATISAGSKATLAYYPTKESSVFKYKRNFRILKAYDPSRLVCIKSVKGPDMKKAYDNLDPISNQFILNDKGADLVEEPIDLISSIVSNNNLALYNFFIGAPALDAFFKNAFFSGSLILATVQGGVNIRGRGKSGGDYCATPTDYKIENFDYCAINKFNFAIKASGE